MKYYVIFVILLALTFRVNADTILKKKTVASNGGIIVEDVVMPDQPNSFVRMDASGSLIPTTTNATLGTPSNQWANGFFGTISGDGSAISNAAKRAIPEPIDWDAGAGGASIVISGNFSTFEMTDANEKDVVGDFHIQSTIDLSTVNPALKVCFVTIGAGSSNANVRLKLEVTYIAVGELTTKTIDETLLITKAVINTVHQMHVVTFTLDRTKMALDDSVSFRLVRLGNDAADIFTGRIGIIEHAELAVVR